MCTKEVYDNYVEILNNELVPALGCTEPIAIAYAAAKAKAILGIHPKRVEVWCSGNIIKNVKAVTVPNTGNLKGINAAAIAGIVGGDPEKGLQVLEHISDEDIKTIKKLLNEEFSKTYFAEAVDKLYISVKVFADNDSAEVCIKKSHTNICMMKKNNVIIFEKNDNNDEENIGGHRELLNIKNILEFASTVKLCDINQVISNQICMNTAISDEGLKNHYGVDVGKTLLKYYGNDIKVRAKARAAAGSDARMSGCSMPVIINSGSGNQGMTVSLPVIEYAKELGVSKEKLYRALVVSNLTAIHQKTAIGKLSAYCGAVSAACGSGAGITYLHGGNYEDISRTIINTIANIGGIVCDGAKPSCAAKIASAVDAAIMAHYMSAQNNVFQSGDGLVKNNVENTIKSIGRMGNHGMQGTDVEILKIMTS